MEKKYKPLIIAKQKINSRWLFRDALGLASSQQWMSYKETVTITSSTVERYKSPVTYHPVPNNDGTWSIYIYLSKDIKMIKDYMQTTFQVQNVRNKTLNMQIYDKFDLRDYFDFIINQCGNKFERKGCYYVDEIFGVKNNLKKIHHGNQQ